MQKNIVTILSKFYSMIKSFLSWLKGHALLIQLVFAICSILCCSYALYVWYRIPHKTVTYTITTLGCIGEPKYKIIAVMNYGDKEIEKDSLGFFVQISHPFKENSPYLFKRNVFGGNVERMERYSKEYEPLCYKYCSAIDSISTLYKSIITLESTLYDRSIPRDKEKWSNQREVAIWCQPTVTNKNVTKNESWFYLKRLLKTWMPHIDTICLKHRLRTSYDNFFPKWFSKGDVSKLNFHLRINKNDLMKCDEIMICFNGSYNLSSITMEPDEAGYDYILFTNPFKLEIIYKKGLEFYASFPIPEKIQQARIAAVVIIIPLLLSYLMILLKKYIAKYTNRDI